MADVVVELQKALRSELKDPMGPIYTDADDLLADAGEPLIAVGDMVTYHLLNAGRIPDVALIDERTERTEVDEEVKATIGGFEHVVAVDNPAATITAEILDAMAAAIRTGESTLIDVEGEEDLAALPALLLAPPGASVVYGQPGEGMVLVSVDDVATGQARDILEQMHGNTQRLWSAMGLSE